jgi:hypothetical protein
MELYLDFVQASVEKIKCLTEIPQNLSGQLFIQDLLNKI